MNIKKIIIFIVLLLVIILGFVIFGDKKEVEKNSLSNIQQNQINSESNFGPNISVLTISKGEVSYAVDKKFFNKPTELVVGKTNQVLGGVGVNSEAKTISAQLYIDIVGFNSGSEGRDKYVRENLPATIQVKIENKPMDLSSGNYRGKILSNLTIGQVSKDVEFDISATFSGNKLVASGTGEILMSDFGIKPPSTLGVYESSDLVKLSFEISA